MTQKLGYLKFELVSHFVWGLGVVRKKSTFGSFILLKSASYIEVPVDENASLWALEMCRRMATTQQTGTMFFSLIRNDCSANHNGSTLFLCKMMRSTQDGSRIKYLTAMEASSSFGFTVF